MADTDRIQRYLQQGDEQILRSIVITAVRFLRTVVFEQAGDMLLESSIQSLQSGWDAFHYAAENVLGRLRNIRDSMWSKLERAGLTGGQLRMKWEVLLEDLTTNAVGRIVKRIDSLLGSLSTVIPGAELMKEYKEHVEISIEHLAASNADWIRVVPDPDAI
jgi:hypothetical protein